MVVDDHGEQHGKQLPREGDCAAKRVSRELEDKTRSDQEHSHERQGTKMLEGLEDEQLAERASECELRERHHDGRVGANKLEGALELRTGCGGVQDRDVGEGKDGDD